MSDLSIEHLLREHREIDRALSELEALLDSQKDSPSWTPEHSQAFARIQRCFDQCVLPHISKEDRLFYPALEDFLPRDIGPLAVLRGEHQDFTAQFARICAAAEALSKGSTEPQHREDFQRAGRAALQTQRNHLYKEEVVLFPMVARFLSPDRDALLLRQLQVLPARDSSSQCSEQAR
jgi:regulator of cell morphogenesis and NO signaling